MRLKLIRAAVELCRIVPTVTVGLGVAVLVALSGIVQGWGVWRAAVLGESSWPPSEPSPLVSPCWPSGSSWDPSAPSSTAWSPFVWRNEVVDTFVEMVAGPWFAWTATGTPAINIWLRSLGAKIGTRGGADLHWRPRRTSCGSGRVSRSTGAACSRPSSSIDHSMDTVTLAAGATLGPHGVICPLRRSGQARRSGPDPRASWRDGAAQHQWTGNPIAPWAEARD